KININLNMTHLKVGDDAPYFEGTDQNGQKISIDDFPGQKIVLYFYPRDNTPGCTAQACNLRDNISQLQDRQYVVIGVSADSVKSHKKFQDKFNLPFPLIADTDKKIIEAYGVWGPKKFMGRTFDGIHRITFLIDESRKIEKIIDSVKTKNHTAQILAE